MKVHKANMTSKRKQKKAKDKFQNLSFWILWDSNDYRHDFTRLV